MKKLSLIIAVILVLFNSCSEEFLTKEPLGSTSENVFYNERGIDNLLIGAYGLIGGSRYTMSGRGGSVTNWVWGSISSDDAYKGSEETDNINMNPPEKWEQTPTDFYVQDKWEICIGVGVDRCNKVMKVVNVTEELGDITAQKANSYRAEIRFLRGFYNFEASLLYGDYIPIFTEETEDPSQVSNENEPGAFLAHVISDLKFAWENLPETQAQIGRPTKYAAMAVAAKAYMQELKYAEAKPLLDNIINSGKYSLMPNFDDNWRVETNNNQESIFEIQRAVNDAVRSENAEIGIGPATPHGSDIGMCCGFHQPSQNLVNAFKVDENGLPFHDTFNDVDLPNDAGIASRETFVVPDDPVDPRLDFTVSRRGIPYKDWGINRGSDWIRKQYDGGPYLPFPKPFFWKKDRGSLSNTRGGGWGTNANNWRYLRYSHVLLWRAEIAAFDGELELARNYINQIRNRAGNQMVMGKVLINELPASVYPWGAGTTDGDYLTGGDVDWTQPAANYKVGLYDSFTTKEEAMKAAQFEQRLEFGTEGNRFFDLRRWDNLPGGMRVDMAKTLNDFAKADLRVRPAFMLGANFNPETDKYVPVPQTQIDLQPGVLVQRPEYR